MMNLKQKYPDITFGTSGLRALVSQLTPTVISEFTQCFVQHCGLPNAESKPLIVGHDLRPSSPSIALSVIATCKSLGIPVDFIGPVPTPALAYHVMRHHSPGLMITGSHIPFDRNGLKFYSARGEITKQDEEAILHRALINLDIDPSKEIALPQVNHQALIAYEQRYLSFYSKQSLEGLHIGVYEHSAVCRDSLKHVLSSLGAKVISVGRSDAFVPVDTEAISEEDKENAKNWCQAFALDALVSTDGDSDRPLVFDEQGQFVPGDILGLMCTTALGLTHLAVPVSCNTLIQKIPSIEQVLLTKIGSPYVIEGIESLKRNGASLIAGFEANGGYILGASVNGLDALPTRDAFLPLLNILVTINKQHLALSKILKKVVTRSTASQRIKAYPTAQSKMLLDTLKAQPETLREWLNKSASITLVNNTDGLRITFSDGDIVHLRPSGNAPELRCYAESSDSQTALNLCLSALKCASEFAN